MIETPTYWTKHGEKLKLAEELLWNFPEQKTGEVTILGGSTAGFSLEVKLAEYIAQKLPFFREIKNVFPESLKTKFPSGLVGLEFAPATEAGGFARSTELYNSLLKADVAIFSGDFSRNSETAIAVVETLKRNDAVLTVLTRDTIDLVVAEMERILEREELVLVGSLAQLQKVLKATYYPRPLLLSQPLFPVVETLHKFTLSYRTLIVTFHEGQVLAAADGKVISVPIEETEYSPITLWGGEVAAKVGTFLKFNPKKRVEALVAGVMYK
ncbi:hypothetical protein IJI72_00840 [Candidatus Saccharibacteria bacterium]|nr:hypothetical protein [Candidatus Saccharibacteria bacterium]